MVYTIPIRSTHNSIFIAYDHACTLCFGYSCFEMAELDVEQLQELLNLLMVLMAQKDRKYFKFELDGSGQAVNANRVVCLLCPPHAKRVAYSKTPSDLKQHLQSKHPSIKHFHFLRAVSLVLSHLHSSLPLLLGIYLELITVLEYP